MSERDFKHFIFSIDNQKHDILDLTKLSFAPNKKSDYIKIVDKERKIAIFNMAIQSCEDYNLVFETTNVPIPLFRDKSIIRKDRTRFYHPSNYFKLLIENFDEPWYVSIRYTGIDERTSFTSPRIWIIPESDIKKDKEADKKYLKRIKLLYTELLKQPNNTIKDFNENDKVEGNFVLVNEFGGTRSDKYEMLTWRYGIFAKGALLPAVLAEERKRLRDGVYHIKAVWRKTQQFYKYPLFPCSVFLEIREAKQIKNLESEDWHFGLPIDNFEWNRKKDALLYLNICKEKLRYAYLEFKRKFPLLVLSMLLLAILIVFVKELWDNISPLIMTLLNYNP